MSEERIPPPSAVTDEQKNAAIEIDTKDGVLASATNSKIMPHRWLPGQSGNPSGKPKRHGDITRALQAGIQIEEAVEGIVSLIRDQSSWRAREAGLKLYLSYMFGTPIQRSVTASTKLESILARVNELSDDEFADVEQKLREG